MVELNDDQAEYVRIWTAILRHVLLYSDEQIDSWMHDRGFPLLLEDHTFAFHEEPWFWPCSTIVVSFPPDHMAVDWRVYENKVFWLLDEALRGKTVDEVDWAIVRSECVKIFKDVET